MSQESRAEYYEKAFARLEETGEHTWNWAAFFGSWWWMGYRKMFAYATACGTVWGVSLLVFVRILRAVESCMYGAEKTVSGLVFLLMFFVLIFVPMLLLGRYGNALYYRAVKGKILRGYHLLEKHRPTSILAIFCSVLFWAADEIAYDLQQDKHPGSEVNAETIHAYLNPNKEKHWTVHTADVISSLVFVVYSLGIGLALMISLMNPTNQSSQFRKRMKSTPSFSSVQREISGNSRPTTIKTQKDLEEAIRWAKLRK